MREVARVALDKETDTDSRKEAGPSRGRTKGVYYESERLFADMHVTRAQ